MAPTPSLPISPEEEEFSSSCVVGGMTVGAGPRGFLAGLAEEQGSAYALRDRVYSQTSWLGLAVAVALVVATAVAERRSEVKRGGGEREGREEGEARQREEVLRVLKMCGEACGKAIQGEMGDEYIWRVEDLLRRDGEGSTAAVTEWGCDSKDGKGSEREDVGFFQTFTASMRAGMMQSSNTDDDNDGTFEQQAEGGDESSITGAGPATPPPEKKKKKISKKKEGRLCAPQSPASSLVGPLSPELKAVTENESEWRMLDAALRLKDLDVRERALSLSQEKQGTRLESLEVMRHSNTLRVEKARAKRRAVAVEHFRTRCEDDMLAGSMVLTASLVWTTFPALRRHVSLSMHACLALSQKGQWWFWRESSLGSVGCYASAVMRAFGSLTVLFLVTAVICRYGSASGARALPLSALLLLGGYGGSYVGWWVVDGLGGNGLLWTVLWLLLILLHTCNVLFEESICEKLEEMSRRRRDDEGSKEGRGFNLVAVALHVSLAFVLPVLIGTVPFVPELRTFRFLAF